jgi:hypothetical protein
MKQKTRNNEMTCGASFISTNDKFNLILKTNFVKTMITKKVLTFFSFFFTFVLMSNAQMTGWPLGTTNATIPTGATNKFFADTVRAKVIGMTSTTITFSNETAPFNGTNITNLNPNNYLLIIQMEGPGAGTHEQVLVSSVNWTTKVITTTASIGNTYNIGDYVQVIKVSIFDNFTLNDGGIVTCSQYNRTLGHGGVLPLIVNNLTINGGYFDAVGKGHKISSTLGMPGSGKPNNPYDGLGANPDINTPYCHSTPPPGTGTLGSNGTVGGSSDDAVNSGTASSYTTPFTPYVGSLSPFLLNLGQWGTLISTHKAGDGEGGGGQGGDGGNSNSVCNNGSGSTGNLGSDGQSGGDAGNAGNGGGAMLIKIRNTLVNNTKGMLPINTLPRFYCNGGAGEFGGAGNGGGYTGGPGGTGSQGCCNNGILYYSGANGGYGDPAVGASGGDGGNGGGCGTIWMKFRLLVPTDCVSQLFSAKGGQGGSGGRASVGLNLNSKFTSALFTDNCVVWCEAEGEDDDCNCDCSRVWDRLKSGFFSNILDSFTFEDNSGNTIVWENESRLVLTENGVRYCCPLWDSVNCSQIIKKLSATYNLEPMSTESVDISIPASSNIWKSDVSNFDAIEHVPASKYVVDLSDPDKIKCHEAGCYPSHIYGSVMNSKPGTDGTDGEDVEDGTYGSDPDDNVNVESGAPVPQLGLDETVTDIFKLSPNPATNYLEIKWLESVNSLQYQIMDITGKTIIEEKEVSNLKDNLKIDLLGYKSGVYLIKIITNGRQQTIQFVVQ